MRTSLRDFLLLPSLPGYELTQKARLLHVMLLAVFLGALGTGIAQLSKGWKTEGALLFVLSAVCLAGFYLYRAGRYDLAGFILCAALFGATSSLLYYGIGLYDESVLGFPIFILCATFLFRRKGLVIATLLAIASITGIYLLELAGIHQTRYPASLFRLGMLAFLFVILALVIWIVRVTWVSHLRELRQSYELTLQGWAKALEYKDGETAGHSRRVTELCVALARAMGCSEQEVLDIRRGAYIHDIGKMAVPDSILQKPGALSDEEWQVMKQHPVRAVELIADIPFLVPAASILHYHHEHWDGSGYPEGLKGGEIPLGARLFTVVDQWDALNSDRPYRKAWPREKVIAYLEENSGRIFDPEIVAVFLSMVRPGGTAA